MEANGQRGYYASAKSGGNGMEDIYLIEFLSIKRERPKVNSAQGSYNRCSIGLANRGKFRNYR